MADLEDLGGQLKNLTVSSPSAPPQQNHHHQQQSAATSPAPFRFSPSSFVAWNYFQCHKQLRLSLDVRRTGPIRVESDAEEEPVVAADSKSQQQQPDTRSFTTQQTTQRGFDFEARIVDHLKKNSNRNINNQNDYAVIDCEDKSQYPPDAPTSTGVERFTKLLDAVLQTNASVVYVAQACLKAPPELEANLFRGHGSLLTFSTMRPDILIFTVDRQQRNNDHTIAISVTIADIKSSSEMKLGHRMQVATYSLVLTALFALIDHSAISQRHNATVVDISVSKRNGQVWLPSSNSNNNSNITSAADFWTVSTFDISEAETHVEEFIQQVLIPHVLQPQSARRDIPFVFTPVCMGCDFRHVCRRDAFKSGDAELAEPLTTTTSSSTSTATDLAKSNLLLERTWRVASRKAALAQSQVIPLVVNNGFRDKWRDEHLATAVASFAPFTVREVESAFAHLARRSRIPECIVQQHRYFVSVFITWNTAESVRAVPCRVVAALIDSEQQAMQQQPRIIVDSNDIPDLVRNLNSNSNINMDDCLFITWDSRDRIAVEQHIIAASGAELECRLAAAMTENAPIASNPAAVPTFRPPRVVALNEAVSAHVALPVVGYAELFDVVKWLSPQSSAFNEMQRERAQLKASGRLYNSPPSLNDAGLAGSNTTPSSHTVAVAIVDSSCALVAGCKAAGSLRVTPLLRRGGVVSRIAGQGADHDAAHPASDLLLRSREFLSYQVSGGWLDRGNPATTLFGRFVPDSSNPSLSRLAVDIFVDSNSSSHVQQLQQSLVDLFAKDAIWPTARAMQTALINEARRKGQQQQQTLSSWHYCTRDRQFDMYSTAGRWYSSGPETTSSKKKKKATTGEQQQQQEHTPQQQTTEAANSIKYTMADYTFGSVFPQRKGSPLSAGTFIESSYVVGRYVLCSATPGGDASSNNHSKLDECFADERYAFASKMDKDKGGASLGLCDIAAVEPGEIYHNRARIYIYVYFTDILRLHVNHLYCLTPRVVNGNMKKTMEALAMHKSLAAASAAAEAQSTTTTIITPLLEAAVTPTAFQRDASIAGVVSGAIARLATSTAALQQFQHSPLQLSDEHRAFLDNIDRRPITLLAGPPGSGKTASLASTLLGLCLRGGGSVNILVVASTHKALQQLHEALDEVGKQLPPAGTVTELPGRVFVQRVTSSTASSKSNSKQQQQHEPVSSPATLHQHQQQQQTHQQQNAGNDAAAATAANFPQSPTSPVPTAPPPPAVAAAVKRPRGRPPGGSASASSATLLSPQTSFTSTPSSSSTTATTPSATTSGGAGGAAVAYTSYGAVAKARALKAGGASNILLCTVWAASALQNGVFDVLVIDEASQLQLVDAVVASMKLKSSGNNSTAAPPRVIVAGDPLQFAPIITDFLSHAGSTLSGGAGSWCRSRSGTCLHQRRAAEDDNFSLITASVFDSLLWTQHQQQPPRRFTDITALSRSDMDLRRELHCVFQLPHSFRSTPVIVGVLQQLYPRFTVAPCLLQKQRDVMQRKPPAGVVLTVLQHGGLETDHIVQRVQFIQRTDPTARIAVVTPRRHQRLRILEALSLTTETPPSASMQRDGDDDEQDNDEEQDNQEDYPPQQQQQPIVVVDTTERMQGDQADAVILAFADVRNTRFALTLRRINVAVSRAKRYVELVTTQQLLSTAPAEVNAMDADDAEEARETGRPRVYVAEALRYLQHFARVATEQA